MSLEKSFYAFDFKRNQALCFRFQTFVSKLSNLFPISFHWHYTMLFVSNINFSSTYNVSNKLCIITVDYFQCIFPNNTFTHSYYVWHRFWYELPFLFPFSKYYFFSFSSYSSVKTEIQRLNSDAPGNNRFYYSLFHNLSLRPYSEQKAKHDWVDCLKNWKIHEGTMRIWCFIKTFNKVFISMIVEEFQGFVSNRIQTGAKALKITHFTRNHSTEQRIPRQTNRKFNKFNK